MASKEFFCYDCDTDFTVKVNGPYQVTHCPFCGSEIQSDTNDLVEADLDD